MQRWNPTRTWHVIATVIGVALVLLCCRPTWPYRIIYNPSESAPRGWYAVQMTRSVSVGRYVLVDLPEPTRHFADQRRYLPIRIPLLKNVGGVAGALVCEQSGVVQINGIRVAAAMAHDGNGRKLLAWTGCRRLGPRELLLISTCSSASFDSRYYGPVTMAAVVGEARPLWTW
jgi:conjugative transfer signal peptidase TraF